MTLLDANHCPGAVLFLFKVQDLYYLHTGYWKRNWSIHPTFILGDFRYAPYMESYPELKGIKIQSLYLDNTFCDPSHVFPPQRETIQEILNIVKKDVIFSFSFFGENDWHSHMLDIKFYLIFDWFISNWKRKNSASNCSRIQCQNLCYTWKVCTLIDIFFLKRQVKLFLQRYEVSFVNQFTTMIIQNFFRFYHVLILIWVSLQLTLQKVASTWLVLSFLFQGVMGILVWQFFFQVGMEHVNFRSMYFTKLFLF